MARRYEKFYLALPGSQGYDQWERVTKEKLGNHCQKQEEAKPTDTTK
jgi:hypothetical protein